MIGQRPDASPRVACLGECMLEVSLDRAKPGSRCGFGFGGDTLNTAVYLAREMTDAHARVCYVTALGTDPLSDDMLSAWASEGVDTSLVARIDDALPGLYLIRTDTRGERSFYYWREQAAARRLLDAPEIDLAQALASAALLYLTGITLAIFDGERREHLLALIASLRAGGTTIAFDTNYRPRLWPDAARTRDAYARLAPLVDVALPGFEDEHALHGDTSPQQSAARWLEFGAREVVVRNGPEPALAVQHTDNGVEQSFIPAPAPCDPVDTTAAGDSFNAAYLAARLRGKPVDAAVAAGHALAARVIMHKGAIAP